MKKRTFILFLLLMFMPCAQGFAFRYSNNVPINKIIENNVLLLHYLQEHRPNKDCNKIVITNSYAFYPSDLQILLKKQFDLLNQETLQMRAILNNMKTRSSAYKLANYGIKKQITDDMVIVRKQYKNIKETYKKIVKNIPSNKLIYVIEGNWMYEVKHRGRGKSTVSFQPTGDYSCINIFSHEYKWLMSYPKFHDNVLKYSRIIAPTETEKFVIDKDAVSIYQKLFDDYLYDLNRIGKGLDINNQQLLRQLDEMQDKDKSM